jgi:ABC-type lipoprotein export system ATPase subunit
VNRVSCAFQPGTLTAIVGPNGAGKTTYFNLVSGQLPATSGSVSLFGEDVTHLAASQRTRRGIGRAFQLTNLFPRLTVLENVRLAVQARAGAGKDLLSTWSSHAELLERARRTLERVALADKADLAAAALPHGDQRKLEVAILLALEPEVFMFDEPTAGMSVDEVPGRQNHPAGRAQDGRGSFSRRPHHRPAPGGARCRRRSGHGHRVADRAGSVPWGCACLTLQECTRTSAITTSCKGFPLK